jgi:hypothetical protein
VYALVAGSGYRAPAGAGGLMDSPADGMLNTSKSVVISPDFETTVLMAQE